jgi:hypothetical protein
MIIDPDLLAIVSDLSESERAVMAFKLAAWASQLTGGIIIGAGDLSGYVPPPSSLPDGPTFHPES